MKRFLITLIISFSTWLNFSVVFASPPRGYTDFGEKSDGDTVMYGSHYDRRGPPKDMFEDLQERRRQREELGFQRLRQMKWQKGYTMPQHYRGDSYKVDYSEYRLPRPERNQQWYKINNDYLLINSGNNVIIDTR